MYVCLFVCLFFLSFVSSAITDARERLLADITALSSADAETGERFCPHACICEFCVRAHIV